MPGSFIQEVILGPTPGLFRSWNFLPATLYLQFKLRFAHLQQRAQLEKRGVFLLKKKKRNPLTKHFSRTSQHVVRWQNEWWYLLFPSPSHQVSASPLPLCAGRCPLWTREGQQRGADSVQPSSSFPAPATCCPWMEVNAPGLGTQRPGSRGILWAQFWCP